MRVLILGGDGYLGWPTAMEFAQAGYAVTVADNYLRRTIAEQTDSQSLLQNPDLTDRAAEFRKLTGKKIEVAIVDLANATALKKLFNQAKPDCIIHYAEQPSAPYSMRGFDEAQLTFKNNLEVTFNVIWGMIAECPDAHLVKLGTMGEYGTPNIDIEEGWLDVTHNGRTQKFLYPRAASSLYHTTKVLDTDLLYFYVRTYGLRVTDLMQGPVYGLSTPESDLSEKLVPSFHYDDIFGTVVNRFLTQAIAGIPLTVYGKGGQTRGYLNLRDTLQCVRLAASAPAGAGELRIFNQFTETFTVLELAENVKRAAAQMGLHVEIKNIENPRKEMEEHYYNPAHTGLTDLGLEPTLMTDEVLVQMLNLIQNKKDQIKLDRILPRVSWKN